MSHVDEANDYRLATDGAVEVAAPFPPVRQYGPAHLRALAESFRCYLRDVACRDDGSAALLFVYVVGNCEVYFTTGFFPTLRLAVTYTRLFFEATSQEEIDVNIFKNDKLFPNIRGVMLKVKRVTLTMNGSVRITEMRDGSDARVEVFFSDHAKSAVLNRTQAMEIADLYGPETEDWSGKPLVLYGEHGTWFGRETWGLRVDKAATIEAMKQAQRQPAKSNGRQAQEQEPADDREEQIAAEAASAAALLFPNDGEEE